MSNPNAKREQYLYDFLNWSHDELFPSEEKPPYRICVGLAPNTRGSKKELGVCFNRAASSDGHNEMFLNPTERDTVRMLATALHEYIHAIDDCKSGHKGNFARLARSIGLEGKLTATVPGDELSELLNWYITEHGDIPAGHMIEGKRVKPKQGTRMIKVTCSFCDFNFRTSRKQLDKIDPDAPCLSCGQEHTLNHD